MESEGMRPGRRFNLLTASGTFIAKILRFDSAIIDALAAILCLRLLNQL
jgi:hypothetical protein